MWSERESKSVYPPQLCLHTVAYFQTGNKNLLCCSQRFGSPFICFTDLYSRRHASLLNWTCWFDKGNKCSAWLRLLQFQHVCFSHPLTGSDLLRACEVPVPDMADGAGGQLGALCAVLHLHGAVQRTRVQERHCKVLFLGLFFLGRRRWTYLSIVWALPSKS